MKITATKHEKTCHEKRNAGSQGNGYYTYHIMTVFNKIIINIEEYYAVYSTGVSFDFQDLNYPSNHLELDDEGGASKLLLEIDYLTEKDFKCGDFLECDDIKKIFELCEGIKTEEDIKTVWGF